MKHNHLVAIIISLVVGVICGFLARTVIAPELKSLLPDPIGDVQFCTADAMLCPDGSYVGRSGPKCEFVCPPLPEVSADIKAQIEAKKDIIVIDKPQPLAVVTSPMEVTGIARGSWYFEGSFPIVVVDWDGLIIGQGVATANGNWMTEEFVPFTANITFVPTTIKGDLARGAIILKKDNPSGLPENDDALEIPIRFSPEATTQ